MRIRLIPREKVFFDLFDQSAENLLEAARTYHQMVSNFQDAARAHTLIAELEHRGDEITHEIVKRLNTTFVTPIDREDIHELANNLDDVLDLIEAAADNLLLHGIEQPTPDALAQSETLLKIVEAVAGAIRHLRDFKRLEPYWADIHQLETEADRVYRRAIAQLFSGEHKAIDVLRWKEIYEDVEHAMDACERVASSLEAIFLKHA